VEVNDGSAQRSQVQTITVAFNGAATFASSPAAAFQLAGPGGNVALAAAVTKVNGLTDVTLTFTGTGSDPVSGQSGGPLSLADGRYQLTVFSAQVSVNGQALDGDNDGNPGGDYVSPTETAGGTGLHLYRLYGDVNGDGVVNAFDFSQFRLAYGSGSTDAGYRAYLDADDNGAVNAFDFAQFRNRYGSSVFV
jgi:hypothetical protein